MMEEGRKVADSMATGGAANGAVRRKWDVLERSVPMKLLLDAPGKPLRLLPWGPEVRKLMG